MKSFIDENFLLYNSTGRHLYNTIAAGLPILDYHNHLNPAHLAANKQFNSITELWITEDPYKHRAMRINGIHENGITGNAGAKEKYNNWVKTFPFTLGNPLYHWSCMELQHVFGISELLSEENAAAIWDGTTSSLNSNGFGAMDILQKWNVELVCTSDDLTDDFSLHQKASAAGGVKVLPSLRADAIIAIDKPGFDTWLLKLGILSHQPIHSLEAFINCIQKQLIQLNTAGCVLADHALDPDFTFVPTSFSKATLLFADLLAGRSLTEANVIALKSYLLEYCGNAYAAFGWTMQLHIGAQRSTSSRLKSLAGPAGGYASIGSACNINMLARLLDTLEKNNLLPGVILYTLNPADNAAFATITGSYAEDGKPGKVQFGPAWWYNDHYQGIVEHLNTIASYGLLSRFIGMTTDSRSILSLSRHDYFRRILCNLLGTWVQEKKIPEDDMLLRRLITDICCNNIRNKLNIK